MGRLKIVQGKTFTDTLRWMEEPLVFKPISGISLASGAPRLTVSGHGIAKKWPVAITRVVGMRGINCQNQKPDIRRDGDYVDATRIDVSTLELNGVSPVDDMGNVWPAWESGGFIQYYTPVSLADKTIRAVLRRSPSDRLLLKCSVGGVSGQTKPTAAGTDGGVTWVATTLQSNKAWEPGATYLANDVIDAKALIFLSTETSGVVADDANKEIVVTITDEVTAGLAKQTLYYEIEAEDAVGAVRLVSATYIDVCLEGAP